MDFGIASSHVRFEGEGDARKLKGTVRLQIPCGKDIPAFTITPMRSQEAGLVAALRKVGAVAWADDLTAAIADADEGFRLLSKGGDRHASGPKREAKTAAPDWRAVAAEQGLLTAPAPKPRKAPARKSTPAPVPATGTHVGSTPGRVA